MEYRLLDAFRSLFDGRRYNHRRSTLGDYVASHFFGDILALDRSRRFADRVNAGIVAVNAANVTVGRRRRRGDGTLGEAVPGIDVVVVPDSLVPRGRLATIEIGVEVKVLAKAMIKQVDRVISDLKRQAEHFRARTTKPICIGIVGINHAASYVSFEGKRKFATDGRRHRHPAQEANEAARRLDKEASSAFDELLLLRFAATNTPPHSFAWVNERETRAEYGAALARVAREYESRF